MSFMSISKNKIVFLFIYKCVNYGILERPETCDMVLQATPQAILKQKYTRKQEIPINLHSKMLRLKQYDHSDRVALTSRTSFSCNTFPCMVIFHKKM